jgi:hypothetical protein
MDARITRANLSASCHKNSSCIVIGDILIKNKTLVKTLLQDMKNNAPWPDYSCVSRSNAPQAGKI